MLQMEVADSPLEQISTCLETLDFPVRARREMRIAAISIGLSKHGFSKRMYLWGYVM